MRKARQPYRSFATDRMASLAAVVLAFAGCAIVATGAAHTASPQPSPIACDPDNGGLTLPPGFCAIVVALQPAGPGHVVTFTQWRNGAPRGNFQTFAGNFAGGDPTPTGAAHRPVGLAQAPDGSLYVTDDQAGWIWRIFYAGAGR